jgi:ATP-dependent 26S proteasome regulatory subunit
LAEFEEGFQLRASSGERYENWEVVGPRGLLLVGLPGGGEPAIWDGKTDQK